MKSKRPKHKLWPHILTFWPKTSRLGGPDEGGGVDSKLKMGPWQKIEHRSQEAAKTGGLFSRKWQNPGHFRSGGWISKTRIIENAGFGVGSPPAKPALQKRAKGGPLPRFFDAAGDPPLFLSGTRGWGCEARSRWARPEIGTLACCMSHLSTGERPFVAYLTSLRYWVIHLEPFLAHKFGGWLFVSTGLAYDAFGCPRPDEYF